MGIPILISVTGRIYWLSIWKSVELGIDHYNRGWIMATAMPEKDEGTANFPKQKRKKNWSIVVQVPVGRLTVVGWSIKMKKTPLPEGLLDKRLIGEASLPRLSEWDKKVRIRGSVIGGIVLGGAIGSACGSAFAFTAVGGVLGAGLGLVMALVDTAGSEGSQTND
jgi:hypothetical protein